MLGFTNIVGNLSPLPELVLWRDPVARSGEEAMAVDEALLEWGRKPVLRAYRWAEPTVTYGYFDEEATARAIFRVRSFILSAAGQGGDCRPSAGYSLYSGHAPQGRKRASFQRGFVPLDSWGAGPRPEGLRGGVRDAGRGCPGRRAGLFSSPVTSDLVLPGGEKLAGGGQRRVRGGVLHQGSIQNCLLPSGWDELLAARLAEKHSLCVDAELFPGMNARVEELLASKYRTEAWRSGVRHGRPSQPR